jgi:hypothetical protein
VSRAPVILAQGYALEVIDSGPSAIIRVTRDGDEIAQVAVIPTPHGSLHLVVESGDQKIADLTLTEGPAVEGAFC